MDSLYKVIILAVIQGLTEFLPVSSSGHLVLAKSHLGLSVPGALLEVSLHFGTLLAILLYYSKSVGRLIAGAIKGGNDSRRYLFAILISMIPAILAYFFLADDIEVFFADPMLAGAMLCVTGLILLLPRVLSGRECKSMSMGRALAVGIAQALAILPGISRSGITIVIARLLGIEKKEAARFSFLMVIPVLVGGSALQLRDVIDGRTGDMTVFSLFVGVAVAAAVGYGAISLLLKALSREIFWLFGLYCLAVGIFSVLVEILGESIKW